MSFTLVTDPVEIEAAQRKLQEQLRALATWSGPKKVGSRASVADVEVSFLAEANMWYAPGEPHDRRWLNHFGSGDPRTLGSLSSTFELNFAKEGSASGRFLRDTDGAIHVAHTGRVGGGRPGIGRRGLLVAKGEEFDRVMIDGAEFVRLGRLGDASLPAGCARFVRTVTAFKLEAGAVDDGEDDGGEAEDSSALWGLEELFVGLDSATRRILIEWLAQVVRLAHEQSPNCWNMTRRGRRLRVNVGRNVGFEYSPQKIVGLALHMPSIVGSASKIPSVPHLKDVPFVDVENSALRRITIEQFLANRDGLRPASDRFIEGSANAFANTPFARYHAADLLAEVERAFGSPLPHPTHEASSISYWKIAPGGSAGLWPHCRDGGYIAIGWGELGDLTGVSRAEFYEKLATALKRYPTWGTAGPTQAWRFSNIPVGAKIVANKGKSRVLGIGTVTGPYYYAKDDDLSDEDGDPFRHRLPVQWEDQRERVVSQPSWSATLRPIRRAVFESIVSAPSPGASLASRVTPQPTSTPPFEDLLARMERDHLHFSPDLVGSYLLALQAKRFVILSGISGTGKTQLALAVAKAFQPAGVVAPTSPKLEAADGVRLRVQPYMLKYNRLVVPSVLADRIEIDEGDGRITVRFGDAGSESLRWSQSTATQLLFKGAARSWFAQLEVGDEIELTWVEDENVLRIDRVEQSPSPALIVGEPTYELVAVRPDWTDNRGLLGYFNPITRDYQGTAFLRLLLRAAQEFEDADRANRLPVPYFVILDEMNLARVEHYFSDFLSALESKERLELHDEESVEEGRSRTGEAVPRRLAIPPNLYFTGTVNVDETTYMFSPKVLDRAFVLEFNEVDLVGGADDLDDDGSLALDEFDGLAEPVDPDAAKATFRILLGGMLHQAMVTLNDRLEVDHRHFGYRVAKEIACFVVLASEQADDDSATLWHAFDIAVLSKVLPKLHGTQQEVGELLERLLAFAVDPDSASDARSREIEWKYNKGRVVAKLDLDAPAPKLPRSAAKLWRMLRRVRLQGYVSFIE